MKIYLASSWKNADLVRIIAETLRKQGFEVDDFTDGSNGRTSFNWSEIGDVNKYNGIDALKDARVQQAFQEDKKWLDWADGVLLILPAGRSAHLEAGYVKGQNKSLVIWQSDFPNGEFDTMYGFADLVTDDFQKVIEFYKSK